MKSYTNVHDFKLVLNCFSPSFSDGGMKIKWVDDTHALGVFASESAGMRRRATENVAAAAQVKK